VSRIVHARRIDGEIRYRVWETIVDQYVSPEMTPDEAREWLIQEAREEARKGLEVAIKQVTERMGRAIVAGTSLIRPNACELNDPWETERCERCECFHHAAVLNESDWCLKCGQDSDDRSHGPTCKDAP
jgi:hypothetical protein